jgi:ATP/maltotriose-dependent transcriptional regulator MalT/DNA-binding SARP family transcriptional activator
VSRPAPTNRQARRESADAIARPRLARRMADALEDGSLLVVAPAGYGKTTAILEAIGVWGGSATWLHCSEADRDAGRLLIHLVGAIRAAVPGAADVFAERLSAAQETVDPGLALQELERELEQLLVDPLVIVIDDAEHLADAAEAERVVADLAVARPAPLRVAVVARRPLSLRAARLSAAGRLREIGAADLAFDVRECAELVRRRTGREASSEEVEALWTATEGWPLGVALAAVSMRRPSGRAARLGTLEEYLNEELLEPLDPALRDALIDSSVAREIDPALAQALGLPEAFLDELRRRGIPHSAQDGRLVYHPLVRDVLAARLARDRPQLRRAQLHGVVAQSLETAGRGPEAIEHWLVAGEHARAGEQVARHGEALLATSPATVAGWLGRLPQGTRAAPGLRLLEGRLASGSGRLDEAEAALRAAVDGYATAGEDELAWEARAALGGTYLVHQRFAAGIALADGFESSAAPAAPLVALIAAACFAGRGAYLKALELIARGAAQAADGPVASLAPGFQAFFVDLPCGRLDAALAGMQETLARLERSDPLHRLVDLLGMCVSIHEERGEPDEALARIAYAERVAERTILGGYVKHFADMIRAAVHARSGRMADAERELARVAGREVGWFTGASEVTRAMIAARRGSPAEVDDAVDVAVAVGAFEPWPARARSTALLVPALVEAGRPARARDLVEQALAVCPALASRARLLALRAWLLSLMGDEPGMLANMTLAWEDAGDARPYLVRSERPRLEPLLWTALERGTLAPESVVDAMEAAVPGGVAVLELTRHPRPAVRRAAVLAAIAAGHPQAAVSAGDLERDPDPGVTAAARAARARLEAEPPRLVFRMLGGFAVRRGAFVIDEEAWRRRAAQRLVRILLLHRDTVMTEDALFAALWPDKPTAAARRSLQVIVSSARAVLDSPGAQRSVLQVTQRTYRLALAERDLVDADEFERAAAVALDAAGPGRVALLEAAAALWTGEPLPEDRYEDWAAAGRERLIDLYGRLLAALADDRATVGDHPGAVDARRRHVELDPLDEAAQCGLMVAYARAGRRGHALRQYLACRRALVDGLGIEPAQETGALQRLILAGEPV